MLYSSSHSKDGNAMNIELMGNWTQVKYSNFVEELTSLAGAEYKKFNSKLIPDTPHLLGVRMPTLRKIASEIAKGDPHGFLACEKSDCHEEVMIDGLVSSLIKADYPQMLVLMERFSKRIYNWAICDTVTFKQIKKYLPQMWQDIDRFILSSNRWVVRYGFKILMDFYLDELHITEVLNKVAADRNSFYYVQMMKAWLIATAFVKQRNETLDFLNAADLDRVVINMTVRKIRDSYRVSEADKELVLQFKK